MADLEGIEEALVAYITQVLYPNGTAEPSSVGAECRIYRGWPSSSGLNADLGAGITNVTVFPSPTASRILPPLPIIYETGVAPPAFTAVASENTVTFVGTPATCHCVGLLVDRIPYVYRPQSGSKAWTVAAEMAALIQVDRITHLLGSTLTIPGAATIVARVVADRTALHEVRRQERDFVIGCWCPDPSLRDLVAGTIDVALSTMPFLGLVDGSSGRVLYKDTSQYDQAQNALLYRRDLVYAIEYPTVVQRTEPSMLFGDLHLGGLTLSA